MDFFRRRAHTRSDRLFDCGRFTFDGPDLINQTLGKLTSNSARAALSGQIVQLVRVCLVVIEMGDPIAAGRRLQVAR